MNIHCLTSQYGKIIQSLEVFIDKVKFKLSTPQFDRREDLLSGCALQCFYHFQFIEKVSAFNELPS